MITLPFDCVPQCPQIVGNDEEYPQAVDIFDIPDDDVEMASIKSRRSSRSGASMPPYTESERGTSPMPSADEEIRAAKYVGTKRPVFLSSGEEEAPKPKKKVKKVTVRTTLQYSTAQIHRHCLQGRREEAFASEVSRTAVFTPSFVDHDAATNHSSIQPPCQEGAHL